MAITVITGMCRIGLSCFKGRLYGLYRPWRQEADLETGSRKQTWEQEADLGAGSRPGEQARGPEAIV